MSFPFSRTETIDALKSHLRRYLSEHAVRLENRAAVAGLLGVEEVAVRRILALHLLSSPGTVEMIDASNAGLRRLTSNVSRASGELCGRAEGEVDWVRTMQRRADTSEPTLFVCAPTERRFDSLRARAIRSALEGCIDLGELAQVSSGSMGAVAMDMAERASASLRHPKLAGVRRLAPVGSERLSSLERLGSYHPIVSFLRLLEEGVEGRSEAAVAEILSEGVLAPSTDAELFELLVSFRLVDELRELGFVMHRLQAVAGQSVPFAVLVRGTERIQVWRQSSLRAIFGPRIGASRYSSLRRGAGLGSASLRPDLVVVSSQRRVTVVEVKLTSVDPGGQIRTGIIETMAYLDDFRPFFERLPGPQGMVVCWGSGAMPNGRSDVMVLGPEGLPEAAFVLAGTP